MRGVLSRVAMTTALACRPEPLASPPGSDEAEASHFSSPNNLKKFLPGMIDPGDATFTAHWDPGSDEDVMLRALAGSRAIRNHRITFPTSGGGTYLWTFPAWIKGIGTETALGQTMSFQVTMRITGVPTMAAGA